MKLRIVRRAPSRLLDDMARGLGDGAFARRQDDDQAKPKQGSKSHIEPNTGLFVGGASA